VKAYSVIISDAAEADLRAVYDYVAARSGPDIAFALVDRIERFRLGLSQTPERGTKRDDLRPGLRTVGSRRRATILIEVRRAARQVVIHGIYYGGRSFEGDPDEA